MKTPEKDIRHDKFDHHQLWREGDVAVYRKTKPTHTVETFEVILVQKHKAFVIGGKEIEAGEHYPHSEQWGAAGWSYMTRAKAEAKAKTLLSGAKGAA